MAERYLHICFPIIKGIKNYLLKLILNIQISGLVGPWRGSNLLPLGKQKGIYTDEEGISPIFLLYMQELHSGGDWILEHFSCCYRFLFFKKKLCFFPFPYTMKSYVYHCVIHIWCFFLHLIIVHLAGRWLWHCDTLFCKGLLGVKSKCFAWMNKWNKVSSCWNV